MQRSSSSPKRLLATWSRLLAVLSLLFGASVCTDDESSPPAAVTITVAGAHALRVGESLALSATTAGATDSSYRWETSAAAIASVNASGTVSGVAEGEAFITAIGNDTGVRAEHVVVVTPTDQPPVEGPVVVIVSGNPFVAVGDTVALSAATVGAEDSGYAWTSSDPAVATVDADGVVTGVFDGEATITATGADSDEAGTLLVSVAIVVPHYDEWLGSAHADTSAEAFNHWNEDDPAEIPTSCARCHSTPGFRDYLGADGSAADIVDAAAPVGTVVECAACHNTAADNLSHVVFPSGVVVDELGAEARCMTCHQGRSSSDDVEEAIVAAGVTSDDEASASLNFLNIHYYAAGATIRAGEARGGYQYATEVYDHRFRHAPGYDTCTGCHDPHTLEVKVDECKTCHEDVTTKDDLKNVRMIASRGQDYDGDGDLAEGIYYEIDGLRTILLGAIQAYTVDEGFGAICYNESAYPYWFQDTDANGVCDAGDTAGYATWSARLVRAAYNYQVSLKDPGAFAHNGKYIIQLVHDAIADLNTSLTTPIDISATVRNDVGHFNGSSEAARHWDEEEEVSASCSKCHGASEGFRFFLAHGVGDAVQETANGLDCATCHDNFTPTWDVVALDSVLYPSGITITEPDQVSNVCAVCHSGRQSKKTIDDAIAANKMGFLNVHYLPAAAVKKGTLAKVGYEYPTKTYAGEWLTHGRCANCHDPVATNHTFDPLDNVACTAGCHAPTPIENVRTNHILDYDDDGNATEPLKDEIEGLAAALLAQMAVVTDVTGLPICYTPDANPYFFKDTDSNGACDDSEKVSANKYGPWTAALMKAAHNYQISQKEHGAWAHNFDYMAQLLIDSIENLGGDVSGYVRP
jgi:hypothetical protein